MFVTVVQLNFYLHSAVTAKEAQACTSRVHRTPLSHLSPIVNQEDFPTVLCFLCEIQFDLENDINYDDAV